MPEFNQQSKNVPSGYERTSSLPDTIQVNGDVLPWVNTSEDLSVTVCYLQSGESFLLASAVGTHPKLVEAADSMNEGQSRNANNMFYSRIPTVVSDGYSPSVEKVPLPVTDFPINVMRNKGGQRVYFSRVSLGHPAEEEHGPIILKLAVCDKNKQGQVMHILAGGSTRQINRKLSK